MQLPHSAQEFTNSLFYLRTNLCKYNSALFMCIYGLLINYYKSVYVLKQYEEGIENTEKDNFSSEKYSIWQQNCSKFIVEWKMLPHRVEDFKHISNPFGHLAW